MIDTIIQYSLLALGLMATLVLFVSFKREAHRTASRQNFRLEELEARLKRNEEEASRPAVPRAAFNFNRRTQALRLLRRGEDVGHVAAALGVPRNEIELLVRVEKIGASRAA